MMLRYLLLAVAFGALAVTGGCSEQSSSGEGEQAAAEFERGPHRGRMLRDGDFAVEITIFETGVPPEFHVYAYPARCN
jgi:cobalt-zinc-cadmium efflux system membrane fusion protein